MEIIMVDKPTALYCQYERQYKPQPVYIELDPSNQTVYARYDPEVGNAVPMAVYLRQRRRYYLNCIPTTAAMNGLMEELSPLFERIFAGHTEEWDGNNDRGRLTPDALEASEELERYLMDLQDDLPTVEAWDAGDWLQNRSNADLGITATTTDKELELIADGITADAGDEIEINGLERELERRREKEQEEE